MSAPQGAWIDAHCHLHDARLAAAGFDARSWLRNEAPHDYKALVNGTAHDDWEAVLALAEADPRVLPSIGLHPWRVNDRPRDWLKRLESLLRARTDAAVGEVGLDNWIEDADPDAQNGVFRDQIALAAELRRPLTVHCLRAWGPLRKTLESVPRLPPCWLLHAYGGPPELVPVFADLGALFSFGPAFADPRKSRTRAAFRSVPEDRLLIETDSPSMPPPADTPGARTLKDPETDSLLNHPANLEIALHALAQLRDTNPESLANTLAANFNQFYSLRTKDS